MRKAGLPAVTHSVGCVLSHEDKIKQEVCFERPDASLAGPDHCPGSAQTGKEA